jgi:hypothetical protein
MSAVYFFKQGREEELNQREGERSNTGEYRSHSWVEKIPTLLNV